MYKTLIICFLANMLQSHLSAEMQPYLSILAPQLMTQHEKITEEQTTERKFKRFLAKLLEKKLDTGEDVIEQFIRVVHQGRWQTCGSTSIALSSVIKIYFPQAKIRQQEVVKIKKESLLRHPANVQTLVFIIKTIMTNCVTKESRNKMMNIVFGRDYASGGIIGIIVGKRLTTDNFEEKLVEFRNKGLYDFEDSQQENDFFDALEKTSRALLASFNHDGDAFRFLNQDLSFEFSGFSAHFVVIVELEGMKILLDPTARQFDSSYPSIVTVPFQLEDLIQEGYMLRYQLPKETIFSESKHVKISKRFIPTISPLSQQHINQLMIQFFEEHDSASGLLEQNL